MKPTALPLPQVWAAISCAAQMLIVTVQGRVRELKARLGPPAGDAER